MLHENQVVFTALTGFITTISMVILLIAVVVSFYLLLDYLNHKFGTKWNKKAGTEDESNSNPQDAAKIRSSEFSSDSDGSGGRRDDHDRGIDGEGRIFLGVPHAGRMAREE